jgi:hypothetical protein
MTKTLKGGCLCGAVSYETQAAPVIVAHCHCTDCQKSSGTGHGTHVCLPEEAVNFVGEIKFYDSPADSGNIVSRGFCPVCGSAIFSSNSSMLGMACIRASSLDDPDAVTPSMIVYTSRAPKWDTMDPSLPSFPEMPEGGPEKVIADAQQ